MRYKIQIVKPIILLFIGSLMFQIIQVGGYPILLAQILFRLGTDSTTVGVFLSISWIAVLVCGPIVPRLVAIAGFNLANAAGSAMTIAGISFLLVSDGGPFVLASAIFLGFGLIIRWISCDSLVVELSTEKIRGRMIGIHEALMGLGIAIAPLLFVFFTINGVIWVSIVLAACGQIAFTVLARTAPIPVMEIAAQQKLQLPYRFILVALAAAFVAGFVENSAIALLPLYLDGFGLKLAVSATLVSAFGFGGTILQPPLGYLSDRRGYGFAQAVCAATILASGGISIAAENSIWILFPALFLMGGAAGGLNTLAVIQAGKELDRPRVPSAMAAIAMLYTLGSIAGPVISGAMIELPVRTAMILEFMTIATILLIVMTIQPRRIHRDA